MRHRKRALADDGRHAGRAHLLDEAHDVALNLVAKGLDTDDHRRALRRVEAERGLVRGLGGLALVGARELEHPVPFANRLRHLDRALDHVAVDLEIAGALLAPDRAQHLDDVGRGTARVVEDAGGAGELGVDAELRVDLLRLMVDQLPELALLLARPAAHDENRHALREGAGDGIHHVVAAGAVRDADDADAPSGARVAVGCETDAGLVGERHDAHAARPPELEEEIDDEVAGDAEEMRDADLLQVGDEKIADPPARAHPATTPRGSDAPAQRGARVTRRTPRRRRKSPRRSPSRRSDTRAARSARP